LTPKIISENILSIEFQLPTTVVANTISARILGFKITNDGRTSTCFSIGVYNSKCHVPDGKGGFTLKVF
jgi:hypothetical protein